MHKNLRSFINTLMKEKDIVEIKAPVDPYLELAEIHRRVIEDEGKTLLFTNIKGSKFPVVTNLFGTKKRVELSFGSRPERFVKDILKIMKNLPPKPKTLWQNRTLLKEMLKIGTKDTSLKKSPVMDIVKKEPNLLELPQVTSWPDDGGAFLTLPLVYTQGKNGEHNLGMYRIQIYDKSTTGIHWQIHKGGGFHYTERERANESLPVRIFLGGPPALILSAIAPLPENVPELLLTSLIIGEKLNICKKDEYGYPYISEAEFSISGSVPQNIRKGEGPFGDHYGYYSLKHPFPILKVNEICHRKDAIYPATIVGKPKQEDYFLGEYLQRLFSPIFPMVMPGVKDLWTYAETGFHPLCSAIVRESYKREALTHAYRIMGEGQLSLTKFLLVTDQIVDLKNFKTLLETVLQRFDPAKDLIIFSHTSMDTLDYTGKKLNHGSKALLLGTGDKIRELPHSYNGPELNQIQKIRVYCKGALVLQGPAYAQNPNLGELIALNYGEQLNDWSIVFIVDDVNITYSQTSFLWTIFTRFDPSLDIYANHEISRNHMKYKLPIIIDARMKPDYPSELVVDKKTKQTVDSRWKEYFN